MIVGATGSAKSTTWKMLKAAMNALKKSNTPGFECAQVGYISSKIVSIDISTSVLLKVLK